MHKEMTPSADTQDFLDVSHMNVVYLNLQFIENNSERAITRLGSISQFYYHIFVQIIIYCKFKNSGKEELF